VFNLPLVLKQVNDLTFLKSIILGFLICYTYSAILTLGLYNKKLAFKVYAVSMVVPLFVAGLYFTNIIPAVPLTLRDANVYSRVSKNSSGNYDFIEVRQTKEFLFGLHYKDHILMQSPGTLYFFGAVQAPAKVTSSISHVWQKKDQNTKKWITKETSEFPIIGGRKDGYRGFTLINGVTKGEYKVVVMVGGKRVVGEKKFIVE
jgi:hypothetical protein